jgi:predicted dithiol-disulfide oxidoreductase (DUF899 family)
MSIRFPNESAAYREARDRLLSREVELRRLREAVARERRALPAGGELPEDYLFEAAPGRAVRLSELFGVRDTLAIYSYMFGPERERPCSMCTPLLDGLDAVYEHVTQRLAFVVVAQSPIERLAALGKQRGWRLPLLSAGKNSYNRDYHGTKESGDDTMLNVFRRDGTSVRHFWGSEIAHLPSDPGQDHRAMDALNPVFALLDVTPEGRGDFYTELEYR